MGKKCEFLNLRTKEIIILDRSLIIDWNGNVVSCYLREKDHQFNQFKRASIEQDLLQHAGIYWIVNEIRESNTPQFDNITHAIDIKLIKDNFEILKLSNKIAHTSYNI